MLDLTTNAVETAAREIQRQLEYHLRGAYMAGYDYVYVAQPRGIEHRGVPQGTFSVRQYVKWSNSDKAPFSTSEYIVRRFDVGELDVEEYRGAMNRGPTREAEAVEPIEP